MERITERNFEMISGKYQKEQLEIEARLKEVTETLNESYEKSQGIRDFPTKRWTALSAKHCTVCGVEYVPGSGISKFCPECREKVRKAQGIETKRKSRERKRQVCIELSAKNDRLKSNGRLFVLMEILGMFLIS